ncbi:MAG: CSLREA domain-containing protein [Anaerolineae bacterium]
MRSGKTTALVVLTALLALLLAASSVGAHPGAQGGEERGLAFVPVPTDGATFTVNSTADAVDANAGDGTCATAAGKCTLRAAVQETNALAGADAIILPAGTYTISIPTAFAFTISDNLAITGAGPASTIIDGGALFRVFRVSSGTVETSGVTIQNGDARPFGGGGILNEGN